jgi:ATP-dependent DNA helicase DinG
VREAKDAEVRQALAAAVDAIGGAPRSGQIEMAEAIANAITDRHHLLVQAGTGTGKSLAYLIPPVVLNKRVLVATATLALQRQLVDRDLPRVIPALERVLGRPITFAIYKGIGNYLCLQKMNTSVPDHDQDVLDTFGALEQQAKALRSWADEPDSTGDRDDAPEVDRKVWAANSVSGRECIGADKCVYGQQCFAMKAKAKAQTADIVVTNHTLLAIEVVDNHPILPDRDVVVLDEAHEFVDRTTQAVTEEINAAQVHRAAGMARRHLSPVLADGLAKAADLFDDALTDLGQMARTDTSLTGRLTALPELIRDEVSQLHDAAVEAAAWIGNDKDQVDPEEGAQKVRARSALAEIQQITHKMLNANDRQVLWFESYFRAFHLAPLDVAPMVRKGLLHDTPVIGTSATLSIGKSFEPIAKSMGFEISGNEEEADSDLDPANVQVLDVGSPFDFAAQGMLYLPRHLPEPGRDGIAPEAIAELAQLIDAAGGRTLALFSSWRGVEAAEAALREHPFTFDFTLLVQRRGEPTGSLVQRFADDRDSVLLGTMSLWQGVDVPGRSCTLVVIDRIPFPRPDDPVMSARSAAADAAGGSGFMSVSLPRAALLLAQGTGRLIRSIEDRGVVAILDSRIVSKRYGSVLLNSMPPLWRTSELETVMQALERLRSDD